MAFRRLKPCKKVSKIGVSCLKETLDFSFWERKKGISITRVTNPSSRTMALGSTQPLTKMSTRRYFWRKADNLTAICESIV
jgi:hypothetical protein